MARGTTLFYSSVEPARHVVANSGMVVDSHRPKLNGLDNFALITVKWGLFVLFSAFARYFGMEKYGNTIET